MIGNQTFTFASGVTLNAGTTLKVLSGPAAVDEPPSKLRWTNEFIWRNAGDPGQLKNTVGALIASAP